MVVHDVDGPMDYLADLDRVAGVACAWSRSKARSTSRPRSTRAPEASAGDVLVLLNDDVEVITDRWLDQLVALAQQDDVGAVGAKLLYEDGKVQHAGHFFANGQVGHIWQGLRDAPGPFAANVIDREVVGVTAACMAQRREVWSHVGGLDVNLPNNFNDVDYCNRIRSHGFRIIQANSVVCTTTRAGHASADVEAWEAERLIWRLGDQLHHDPFTPSFSGSCGRSGVGEGHPSGASKGGLRVVQGEGGEAVAGQVAGACGVPPPVRVRGNNGCPARELSPHSPAEHHALPRRPQR